jgi:tripartite-type tricarboxylate transporter receptor subunit TctC
MRAKLSSRNFLCGLVTLAAVGLLGHAAGAETYPSRIIRIVVPFPAGGLVDGVARIIQPSLQQALGQTIVIENRPGASGIIGTDAVAKAAPDGYTLLMVASSHTVTPATNAKLPYDIERDLSPVGLVVKDPLLFVVNNSVPAKTLAEFVALAKAEPGKLTYATPGTDSQAHLVTELFSQRAGIKMLEVPYRGGAPAVLALIAGETQFSVLSAQVSVPQIRSGAIRAIASGGASRTAQFPDLPTVAESGFPGFEAIQWVGMLAPPNTPKEIIERVNIELNRVLKDPDVISKLAVQGMTANGSSPEEFQKLISAEVKEWTEVARTARGSSQ